jgi:hypothetical protein
MRVTTAILPEGEEKNTARISDGNESSIRSTLNKN